MDVISDESAAEFFDTMDSNPRLGGLVAAFVGAVGVAVCGMAAYGLYQMGAHPGTVVGGLAAAWGAVVSLATFCGGVKEMISPQSSQPDPTP